jgi:hypothetical protein
MSADLFKDFGGFAMPNPISRIVPNAIVDLDTGVLDDKPAMAILVAKIFAVWASIETELSFLMVRILGASPSPAMAIYDTLTAQHLQLGALEAAARVKLSIEHYAIFLATISIAKNTQKPRNHLAHWNWGGCEQRPDLLALIDPLLIRENQIRLQAFAQHPPNGFPLEVDGWNPDFLDPDYVLGYSADDLRRALRDLKETNYCLTELASYLLAVDNPRPTEPNELSDILARLNASRLFREAKARIDQDLKNNPPKPYGLLHSRWQG